jgi:GAF domain-containing protein
MSMGIQGARSEPDQAPLKKGAPTGDDAERLEAVRMLGSLLVPPLQTVCNEAHEHFCLQGVAINLVDAEEVRQQVWAGRSRPMKVARTDSPCDAVVRSNELDCEVHVIEDMASDERCRSLPFRTGFYAGVAITYSIGGGAAQRVGTLCVYDSKPQESFCEEDRKKLKELGARVSSLLSSPLGLHLDRSQSEEHRLHSVGERVEALMV